MSSLDEAVDVSEIEQSNLWVLYGKSGSGKTWLLSTFPKPLLYLQLGDDGTGTIRNVDGIKVIVVKNATHLNTLLKDSRIDKKYATVAVDLFGMLANEWIDDNIVSKKKRMTQNNWGELKTDSEEIIKSAKILAKKKHVVLTAHEVTDSFEGMEDEIVPDIRPSINKGSRSYLEGMSNYGIHTTVVTKQKETANGTVDVEVYACHLGANPYYWTKTQKPPEIKLPKIMLNPTYDKLVARMRGEK